MSLLVNIDVDDLDAATRFYTHTFGLHVGRFLGSDVVELLGAPAPIYLLKKAPGSKPAKGSRQRRTYRRHWTPVHLDFAVSDINVAVERALAAGATLEEAVTNHAWGKLAPMADPFGHGFCFVQFAGRGYDEFVLSTSRS